MRRQGGQPLTAEERERLLGLAADLRELRGRWFRLVADLQRAPRSVIRSEVQNRLCCVLHDCVQPALRDLQSIEEVADGKPQ